MKIETFLPLFPGFYNTGWEINVDNYLSSEDVTFDDITIDYDNYNEDVIRRVCEFVKDNCSIISRIIFQGISSPKEYNFRNDAGNVEITFNIQKLKKFILKNKSKLEIYLKQNYTSYDGFMSFHSNQYNEWFSETNGFTKYTDTHKIGSLLEFYFNVNDISSNDALDYVQSEIESDNYITTSYRDVDDLHGIDRIDLALKAYDMIDLNFGYMAVLIQNMQFRADAMNETVKEYICEREADFIISEAKIQRVSNDLTVIIH